MKTYHLANPLMRGDDLQPLQRALRTAGLYNGLVDGIFGPGTAQSCQAAKYRLGYSSKTVLPTGGQMLLDYLQGKKKLSPAMLVRRKARGYGLDKNDKIRQAIVSHALWGFRNNGSIHYKQSRPMENLHKLRQLPWYADCSEFITTIYCWAGAPDPNGLNYNGEGYTGTMLQQGTTIPLTQAKPADVVIWGTWPGHHTAVIVDVVNHADPMIVSHGSEAGPLKIKLSEETAAQNRPFVVKRYIGS